MIKEAFSISSCELYFRKRIQNSVVSKIGNLNKIANFSTSAFEFIEFNDWNHLQMNYQKNLRNRLLLIEKYLVELIS